MVLVSIKNSLVYEHQKPFGAKFPTPDLIFVCFCSNCERRELRLCVFNSSIRRRRRRRCAHGSTKVTTMFVKCCESERIQIARLLIDCQRKAVWPHASESKNNKQAAQSAAHQSSQPVCGHHHHHHRRRASSLRRTCCRASPHLAAAIGSRADESTDRNELKWQPFFSRRAACEANVGARERRLLCLFLFFLARLD